MVVVSLVVAVRQWERQCGGGVRLQVAAAQDEEKRERCDVYQMKKPLQIDIDFDLYVLTVIDFDL